MTSSIPVKRRNGRRGQAMVESALVLLVLIALLIGILDVAQALFVHQGLVERARSAARYGAVRYSDLVAVRNMVMYGQPAVPGMDPRTPVTDESILPSGFMGLRPHMVQVVRNGANTNDDRIEIKIVNYPFQFFSPWMAGNYTGRTIVASTPVESW